jgi:hypothetical protein
MDPDPDLDDTAITAAKIADELRRVQALVQKHRNGPLAHSWIDDLYLDVLRGIAEGAADPQALAVEALKAEDIDFPRHFDALL